MIHIIPPGTIFSRDQPKTYYVYVLRNGATRFYVGMTTDPFTRLRQHQLDSIGRVADTIRAHTILEILSAHAVRKDAEIEEVRQIAAHKERGVWLANGNGGNTGYTARHRPKGLKGPGSRTGARIMREMRPNHMEDKAIQILARLRRPKGAPQSWVTQETAKLRAERGA